MGWRDWFKASGESGVKDAESKSPASVLSANTITSWKDADINAIRAATAEAAGQPIDLSYITDDYMAPRYEALYASEGAQSFKAPQADAIIATYGGTPLSDDHLSVWYGHRAALLIDRGVMKVWFFSSVTFEDGEFKRGTQLLRGNGDAAIVSSFDDGSPLWEFRI